ncbi:unnamed protein product [Prunus armeniaca]
MAANPDFEEKKADHLYRATCPFKKLSNFFSNETIMNVGLIAIKLRITGITMIDLPQLTPRRRSKRGQRGGCIDRIP